MEQIRKLIMDPREFLPQEQFKEWTKYAVIICNKSYDTKYTTMKDLPQVEEDFKNAKLIVKFMGIADK